MRLRALAGFFLRLNAYLAEMFPVLPRLGIALLLYASLAAALGRRLGVPAPVFSWATAVGGASVFALMLILRLMDELKDIELDRELFPKRPLPAGRVRASDLRGALLAAQLAYLGLHAAAGLALLTALAVLGYAQLMFRWFFAPNLLRPRLLLTLVTHTPISPLMLVHLLVLFAVQHGIDPAVVLGAPALSLVAAYWALVLGWEVARKIRSAAEEDAYVTYSRRLGRRGAVALCASAQAAAFLIAVMGFVRSVPAVLILVAGFGITLTAQARFLLAPGPRTSRLQPSAELHTLGVFVAVLIG